MKGIILLVIATILIGNYSIAQKWELEKCNFDSIAYPYENGQGSKSFPVGSCPPPAGFEVKCYNNSKLKVVKAESQSFENYFIHVPEYAVDDYMVTRWSAGEYVDSQWFQVDMGEEKQFKRIYLTWELAHATDYLIQVSNDKQNWDTVATVKDGDGFLDVVDINAKGRYIRMQSIKKANEYGISLFDFTICAEIGN